MTGHACSEERRAAAMLRTGRCVTRKLYFFCVFISTAFSCVPVICMAGGEKAAFPSFF